MSEVTFIVGIKPSYIPGTRYFKDLGLRPTTALTMVIAILYESSIFLAISYRMALMHPVLDSKVGWGAFVFGKALPRLSRAVLHGGQQYYL